MGNKVVLTISGQSGSGKSTLENMLVERYPEIFEKVISHTTREKRYNEVNGQDYHFVKQITFDSLEMMETVSFNGNSYGASKQEFERVFALGKSPVIVVTPEGTEQIEKKCIEYGWLLQSIFVDSSNALLMKRLFTRGVSDMQSSRDKDKTMQSYLNRIENMFAEESTWEMYCDWMQKFDKFDSDVEDEVIDEVIETHNMLRGAEDTVDNIKDVLSISSSEQTNDYDVSFNTVVKYNNWQGSSYIMIIHLTCDEILDLNFGYDNVSFHNSKYDKYILTNREKYNIFYNILKISDGNFNYHHELVDLFNVITGEDYASIE